MAFAGIICEYNPFHTGHAAHIAATRERLGGDTDVICVMSGNFVQRGEPAVMKKHARAEAAVRCGADLVLENPVPWATASAERFALGAVSVLNGTGLPVTLSFGSECGDAEKLERAANALLTDEAHRMVREALGDGLSYAAARQKAADALLGSDADVLKNPNDILGIEYMKAIGRLGADMDVLAVKRVNTEHDGDEACGMAPASLIREKLLAGESADGFVPECAREILARETGAGRAPVTIKNAEGLILYRLRTMSDDDYALLPDGSEGLWMRLRDAGYAAKSYEEVLEKTKTKRYAMSRIRRMVLAAFLGTTAEMSSMLPPYIRVLAFNERGQEILKKMKKTATLPIVTKPASAKKLPPEARKIFEFEARTTDIYELMYPDNVCGGGGEWTLGPVTVK